MVPVEDYVLVLEEFLPDLGRSSNDIVDFLVSPRGSVLAGLPLHVCVCRSWLEGKEVWVYVGRYSGEG